MRNILVKPIVAICVACCCLAATSGFYGAVICILLMAGFTDTSFAPLLQVGCVIYFDRKASKRIKQFQFRQEGLSVDAQTSTVEFKESIQDGLPANVPALDT